MTTLALISILLAALGLGAAIWRNNELPESMSVLVYSLKKRHRWLWSVWIWSMAFTAGIPMIDALGGTWWLGLTGFVTTGCLGVVGALVGGASNGLYDWEWVSELIGKFYDLFGHKKE